MPNLIRVLQRTSEGKKVKAEHLYRASSSEPHPRSAQVWITQLLPCKYTIRAFHLVNIHQTAPQWLG